MYIKNFLILSSFFIISALSAQKKVQISGIVVNETAIAAEYVTVALLNPTDSTLIKGTITNVDGKYLLESVKQERYLLSFSQLGVQKQFYMIQDFKDSINIKVPTITLLLKKENLKEITVEYTIPQIEYVEGALVLNVEKTALAAGNNLWELLEKTPGVIVDNQNETIKLSNNQGVTILIDDRNTYLSGQSLANLLKSIQSDNVKKIEVIKNPSAKYDASGTGGIINIRLTKKINLGLNGSLNANLKQASHIGGGGGFNLNFRKNKINLFADFSSNYFNSINIIGSQRKIFDEGNQLEINYREEGQFIEKYNYFKAGTDIYLNDNNILGFFVSGNLSNSDNDGDKTTDMIGQFNEPYNQMQGENNYTKKFDNGTINLNYERKLDTLDGKILFDFNINNNENSLMVNNNTVFLKNEELNVRPNNLFTNARNNHQFAQVYKADLIKKIWKGKLEAGIKASITDIDNSIMQNDFVSSEWKQNTYFSNEFSYNESIFAAYLSYGGDFKKLTYKAGIRTEQTLITAVSKTLETTNKQNYFDFFPSINTDYKLNKNHTIGLAYNYRIQRPWYENLNPFLSYQDEYNYESGNVDAKPEYIHRANLSYNYKNKLFINFDINHWNNSVGRFFEQNDSTYVIITKHINFKYELFTGFNMNGNFNIGKWCTVQPRAGFYYDVYVLENSELKNLNGGTYSYSGGFNANLKANKKLSFEINCRYHSGWLWGVSKGAPQFWHMVGAKYNLLDNKATLRVQFYNPLGKIHHASTTDFANIHIDQQYYWESQSVRVAFNYSFGNAGITKERTRLSDDNDRGGKK